MGGSIAVAFLTTIFLVLSMIHIFWAFGGRLGSSGAVPETKGKPAFEPGPMATLGVAAALLTAAGIVLWRSGWWSPGGPPWIPRVGIWVLAGLFFARAVGEFRLVGFFKKVRGTRFARLDDFLFSPLCLLISLLSAWVALSP